MCMLTNSSGKHKQIVEDVVTTAVIVYVPYNNSSFVSFLINIHTYTGRQTGRRAHTYTFQGYRISKWDYRTRQSGKEKERKSVHRSVQ